MLGRYGLTTEEEEKYRKEFLERDSIKRAIAYSKKRAFEEGYKEGYEIGYKEGLEIERREIIKKCLQKEVPIELISSATGLSVEQIKNISECRESTD